MSAASTPLALAALAPVADLYMVSRISTKRLLPPLLTVARHATRHTLPDTMPARCALAAWYGRYARAHDSHTAGYRTLEIGRLGYDART